MHTLTLQYNICNIFLGHMKFSLKLNQFVNHEFKHVL